MLLKWYHLGFGKNNSPDYWAHHKTWKQEIVLIKKVAFIFREWDGKVRLKRGQLDFLDLTKFKTGQIAFKILVKISVVNNSTPDI